MQVPVYLITGFLESGKTTFIEQVILEGNFVEDEKNPVDPHRGRRGGD